MGAGLKRARLFGWLMAGHFLAALVAIIVFYTVMRRGAPDFVSAAAGLTVALVAGALVTQPLRYGLEVVTLALARLLEGLPASSVPTSPASPVADLLALVDAFGQRHRETDAARENALRQAQEAAIREERNRLARDLHDSIKQQLFSLSASIAAAQVRWESDPPGARQALDDARRSAQEASAEMRALLQQLRPAALAGAGLPQALAEQCEALKYRTGADVRCEFSDLPAPERIPGGATEGLFRIAQEALNNIARHAGAKNVLVRLGTTPQPSEALQLEIVDDGRGFEPAHASGMGLANMRERARELGAELDVIAAPGAGARIVVRAPLARIDLPREERMNETTRIYLKQGKSGFFWALLGAGVAALMALSVVPFAYRVAQGHFSGVDWIFRFTFPVALALLGVIVAGVGFSRSRRALLALKLGGPESETALLLAARERASLLMWAFLVMSMTLPAALLRYGERQFPTAALLLGAALVGRAILQIARLHRLTDRYWQSLPEAACRAEIEQAWSQRMTPLLVLLVTVPGYLFLRFGGEPAGVWFAFPPAREDVFNMIATLYVGALLIWLALHWRQLSQWRKKIQ